MAPLALKIPPPVPAEFPVTVQSVSVSRAVVPETPAVGAELPLIVESTSFTVAPEFPR